jgi:hypothetical protein
MKRAKHQHKLEEAQLLGIQNDLLFHFISASNSFAGLSMMISPSMLLIMMSFSFVIEGWSERFRLWEIVGEGFV